MFAPHFSITPEIATSLMGIEGDRQAILELPINVEVLAGLRETARLAATHYSTQIEGNRLTQAQVAEVLTGAHFPGRERDEAEVRNYYKALERIEELAGDPGLIDETELQRIHGLAFHGKAQPTPYRGGQNVIRETGTGRVVYMPPEAQDVPQLMIELFGWLNERINNRDLPMPMVAALTHYQYATVHPYFDGNGRTARLLTTLILHRTGYGLKGIYSLDEHYARNLSGYYDALTVGPSHNYYLGRAEAEVTGFVDYFCRSMADALSSVRARAAVARESGGTLRDDAAALRMLDPRKRRLLELFRVQDSATNAEMAAQLALSARTVSALSRRWLEEGFLEVEDPARRSRRYRLAEQYERLAQLR